MSADVIPTDKTRRPRWKLTVACDVYGTRAEIVAIVDQIVGPLQAGGAALVSVGLEPNDG